MVPTDRPVRREMRKQESGRLTVKAPRGLTQPFTVFEVWINKEKRGEFTRKQGGLTVSLSEGKHQLEVVHRTRELGSPLGVLAKIESVCLEDTVEIVAGKEKRFPLPQPPTAHGEEDEGFPGTAVGEEWPECGPRHR